MGNTQSMIFTLFGDYIRHYGNKIWIGSLIRLLKEFGHNEQSVRVAASRMVKQGWLQSQKNGNKSYYFLTKRGEKRMDEAGRRIFKLSPHKWDGKWRILMYTIPEKRRRIREDFRKELMWSGFGHLSNSCCISPNNLEKEVGFILEKYEITPYVDFFVTDHVGPKDNHSIVERSFQMKEIEKKYKEFIANYEKQFEFHEKLMKEGKMTDADCFVERTKLVHEYRKFLFIDPGLPKELLPDIWCGQEAAQLFRQYYQLLAVPASRFFESVFETEHHVLHRNDQYDATVHPYIVHENN